MEEMEGPRLWFAIPLAPRDGRGLKLPKALEITLARPDRGRNGGLTRGKKRPSVQPYDGGSGWFWYLTRQATRRIYVTPFRTTGRRYYHAYGEGRNTCKL